MLFLKSFFRKKSTIIYLIIYSIILATIISTISLINYNKEVINNIFQKQSYILLTSSNDYYSEILKNSNISKIDRILLFKPNDKYGVFSHAGYSISTGNMEIEYSGDEQTERKIEWEEYFSGSMSAIFIVSDKDKDFKLNDDEIALSLHNSISYKSEILDSIIGKNIAFNYDNQEVEFIIKEYYTNNMPEMTISESKFNELANDTYSYKILVNNYEIASEVAENLKQLGNGEQGFYADLIYAISGEDSTANSTAYELVDIFKFISYVTIIIFIFVFIVVTINILRDEDKNTKIEMLLGYSKSQAKKYSILKILSISIMSLIIAIILSIIINITINSIFGFNLSIIL